MKLKELFTNKSLLTNEVRGGITAGIVTIPIALAFGQASGIGPMAGLYSALIVSFFGTLLGGTKTQVSSPVGVLLIAVILVVKDQIEYIKPLCEGASPEALLEEALPHILLIFLLAGVFQYLIGIFRLGIYIRYLPFPVISGFSTGIGLLIIILQIKDLFQLDLDTYKAFQKTDLFLQDYIHYAEYSLILAAVTLGIIIIAPKITPKIPSTLLALIITPTIPILLNWGKIPMVEINAEQTFTLHTELLTQITILENLPTKLLFAISLALLSSINTLLTSLVADQMTGQRHKSNKELAGQGIGNIVAALFGAIPGSGAVACTGTNIKYGGRTKVSAIIATLLIGIIAVFGETLINYIPKAVLDGVLLYVGYIIIDKKTLSRIKQIEKTDILIMSIVIVLTLFGQLLYSVAIGIGLASLFFMKKMADRVELDSGLKEIDTTIHKLLSEKELKNTHQKDVYIKNIQGPLFFGFSSRFESIIEKNTKDVKTVIFNFEDVPFIDQSGLNTLERVISLLTQKKVNIYLCHLQEDIETNLLNDPHFKGVIKKEQLLSNVEEAIIHCYYQEQSFIDPLTQKEIKIPSAFTPNGDGIHDCWEIEGLEKIENCSILIRNREGDIIYTSTGYITPWDGNINGKKASEDKYFYEIEIPNQGTISGLLFLFR